MKRSSLLGSGGGGPRSDRVSIRSFILRGMVTFVLTMVVVPAYAYRPFDSTDAAVADAAKCEVELGPAGYLTESDGRFLVAPTLILNFGLTDRIELVVEGKNAWLLAHDGSSPELRDNAVSIKAVLRDGSLQQKAGASLAIEVSTLLPSSPDEHGVGEVITGIASKQWRHATVHVNVTVGVTRAHDFARAVGLIAEGPSSWRVRPVLEVVAEQEDSRTSSGLVGAIWQPREHLSVDAGWRRARVDGFSGNEFRAGLTFSFRVAGA
jgi:hypothetical protein